MRKWLVPGIVAAVLLMGAAAFGYRTFKQSRPAPYWVVITLQSPSGDEQLKAIEKACREQVTGDAVILPVVRECDLAREWKLADENAAAAELRRRAFVQLGRTGELKVGVHGTRKEARTSEAVAKGLGRKFMERMRQAKAAPASE